MKHVFVIHSNITYLSALATVAKENIDSKDVLIMTKAELDKNLPITPYYLPFDIELRHFWKAKWQFRPYRYVDKFLKKHIGNEEFVAYVEAMTIPAKLVVSSPQCVGYHFIEEGDSAHCDFLPKNIITYDFLAHRFAPLRPTTLKRRIVDIMMVLGGVSLKNWALPFMPQCYYHFEGIKFYGFGSKSFKQAENRVQLEWDELTSKFQFDQKYNLDNSSIWLGTSVGNGDVTITLEDYCKAIEQRCIPHLKSRGVTKVYVKHHPITRRFPETRKAEVDIFKKHGIDVEVIDDYVCLEIELLGRKNVSLYMLVTSIASYAHQMGHRDIYTIAKHFPGYVEGMKADVWDNMKFL